MDEFQVYSLISRLPMDKTVNPVLANMQKVMMKIN